MAVLKFDQNDLEANRQGRITTKQRRLIWQKWRIVELRRFGKSLIFFALYAVVWYGLISPFLFGDSTLEFTPTVTGIFFFWFIYGYYLFSRYRNLARDIHSGVAVIHGPIHIVAGSNENSPATITVGDIDRITLPASRKLAFLLQNSRPYAFYMLAGDRLILSVEHFPASKEAFLSQIQAQPYGSQLLQLFDATPEDIEANREGTFTARQRKTIFRSFRTKYGATLFLTPWFVLFAIGGAVFIPHLFNGVSRNFTAPLIITGFIITLVIIPGIWLPLRTIRILWNLRLDLREKRVEKVEGHIEFREQDSRVIVLLNNQKLVLPKNSNSLFANRGSYRFYFTPRTQLAFAAEHLLNE